MKKLLTSLILSALSLWGQSVTVSTSSTIQDTTGAVATSGYVEFDLSPSGPFYRVVGTGVLVTNVNRCGIDATGHVKNTALSGSCLVWGNDIVQPANSCYNITYVPEIGSSYTVSNVLITGSGVDISNPTFCPTVKLVPDYVTITTTAQNGNIMPSANHVFSIGASGFRYAQGWFDTINATTYGSSPQFITPNFITGFQIGGAAPSGHVARGSGIYYVDAQLGAADLSDGTTGSGAVVRANAPTFTANPVFASSTGSGAIVQTTSPTIITPTISYTPESIATVAIAANAVTQDSFNVLNSDASTGSASYVNVTGSSVTVTTTGGDVLIFFCGPVSEVTGTGSLTISIDGVDQAVLAQVVTGMVNSQTSFFFQKAGMSAASHTFILRAKTSAGTISLNFSSAANGSFGVVELKR